MHFYPFNVGDYRRDTIGLTPIEDCAYRRIIDSYYLNEHPFNTCSTDVARLIGMSEHAEAVDYILRRFFREENGSWLHDRIEFDLSEYRDLRPKRVRAGKASGKKRRELATKRSTGVEQVLSTCSTQHEQVLNQPRTKNQEPRTKNQEKEITRAPRVTASRPAEIPEQLWADFLALRRAKKSPLTEAALAGITREAGRAGWTLEQALSECCQRGWQGFKAAWVLEQQRSSSLGQPGAPGNRKTNEELTFEAGKRVAQKIYDDATPEDQAEFNQKFGRGNVLCLSSKM